MSATRDLIAAALTAADELDMLYENAPVEQNSNDLREACARAMCEPAAPVMYIDDSGQFHSRVSAEQVAAVLGPVVDNARSLTTVPADCPHGVRIPHECKACSDAISDADIAAWVSSQTTTPAEVPMPEHVEQLAITRYRSVPNGMFGYKVVAGDGGRSVFEGTKSECTLVARRLTEAFLDGAHVAGDAREAAGYARGLAEAKRDAERYRWLTEDHDSPATRERCRELLGRMPVMSYSAASAAIDAALRGEVKP